MSKAQTAVQLIGEYMDILSSQAILPVANNPIESEGALFSISGPNRNCKPHLRLAKRILSLLLSEP